MTPRRRFDIATTSGALALGFLVWAVGNIVWGIVALVVGVAVLVVQVER